MNFNHWKKWSLPSKLTAIGTIVGIISLIITIAIIIIDKLNQDTMPKNEFQIKQISIPTDQAKQFQNIPINTSTDTNSKKEHQKYQLSGPQLKINQNQINSTNLPSNELLYKNDNAKFKDSNLKNLTILEIEDMLQNNREKIEECITGLPFLSLEFVFSNRSEGGINLDIYAGGNLGVMKNHSCGRTISYDYDSIFEHEGYQLLSYSIPIVNGCIIKIVKSNLAKFTLSKNVNISHQYITYWGSENYRSIKRIESQVRILQDTSNSFKLK